MRLYNRNIMRKRLKAMKRMTTVDRDAIVWSVDTSNFYCLVKIQGSNTTIKAHYPRNWKVTPTWLKRGNAVRLRHRSGAQGFIEVIGHGRAIPTPVEGDSLPTPQDLTDGVVTGMNVLEHTSGGMNVYVNSGTYRIDGTLYVYSVTYTGYIVMDDPAPMTMGVGTVMGISGSPVAIPIAAAPAAGYGRYDALVIAADGTVDVVTGSTRRLTDGAPTFPSTPSDHILIDYIFIYGGMTAVTQSDIGARWQQPTANTVVITVGSPLSKDSNGTITFPWDAGDDTPYGSITFTIKDQYGNNRSISVEATMTLLNGTGGVSATTSGFGASASKTCTSSCTFYYERNQIAGPEVSPLLQVAFAGYPSLTSVLVVSCLDVSGNPV
jgi:hypothetical protein